MKFSQFVTVLAVLNALLIGFTGVSSAAEQGKRGAGRGGGQAASHMSSKGATNSNAQWSADPVRGWVRAEERHQLRDEKRSNHQSKDKWGKKNPGKSNGKK